jgi:hypothetical protein
MRDTIPTPAEMGNRYFGMFDFYFAPSQPYIDWTIRAVLDAMYFSSLDKDNKSEKVIIPGGYVKKLPFAFSAQKDCKHKILYVPSVFSPEHTGHVFHRIGEKIIKLVNI